MKINNLKFETEYEKGKALAANMFVDDAILAIHTSNNLESDLRTLARQYDIDVDIKQLLNELKNIKKGK